MENTFFDTLIDRCKSSNTLLCIGLDPRIKTETKSDLPKEIVSKNQSIIEQTYDLVACYKPNIAFYAQHGIEGLKALQETLSIIPKEIPVILDAKRGDIGSTAEAYAREIFGWFNVDATTLSPYLGKESVLPFLEYREKGLFLLCRTSNPGADRFQQVEVEGIEHSAVDGPAKGASRYAADFSEPLFLRVAKECVSWSSRIGLVVAGNEPQALRIIRENFPDVWILAPGIGAQGGTINEAIQAGKRKDGLGILPVVARGISQAEKPRKAALQFRDTIRQVVKERKEIFSYSDKKPVLGSRARTNKEQLLTSLVENKCFQIGDFVLKSGMHSPFYLDLRRVMSNPELLRQVADAYLEIIKPLFFDRLAAIPVASLPLASAVAIKGNIPLLYPRIPVKPHGSGNRVEGNFNKGERVLLLDDLITTGKSKLEAAEVLRDEGLYTEDLVVLIERGTQGRKDMDEAGIRLYSYADVGELFPVCTQMGIIDEAKEKELHCFIKEH